ncbi:isoprenylcysteine carboxylmethyltransferase family protein [Candidatus Binatia bacterium]|nr:isoprenylcysteine carboxylmethyltransferase family protein [Candidatus Binatia bacterium]
MEESPHAWRALIWALAVGHVVVGTGILLAILRQPDAADPWSRVDGYVIVFLVAGGIAGIDQAVFFLGGALRSTGFTEEMGLGYDPGVLVFVLVAEVGKLATALDYARWRLTPGLDVPALRGVGVVIAVLGATALVWTDRRLADHFSTAASAAKVMTDGPYRWIRHPRYASVLLLMLGMALVFGSLFGWLSLAVVVMAVLRRIAREEPHLRETLGAEYDAYASRTARLVPGVF